MNDKSEIKKSAEPSFKKVGGDLYYKAVIHSMPKRFLGIRPTVQKTKHTGLIIMIIGAFLLLAGLATFYFYLNSSTPKTSVKINVQDDLSVKKKKTKKQDTSKNIEKDSANSNGSVRIIKNTENEEDENESLTEEDKDAPIKIIGDNTENANNLEENKDFLQASSSVVEASSTKAKQGDADLTEPKKEEESKTKPRNYIKAQDTDGDGLTDAEENILLSKVNDTDSDKDGYDDYSELINLYNPVGNGFLMANMNISKYINSSYDYSLYYPSYWQADKIGADDAVIFKIKGGEFIQVIVQDIKTDTLSDWYKLKVGKDLEENQKVKKEGWDVIRSKDGVTYYLKPLDLDKLFVLTYNTGLSNVLNYPNILLMMVNSLELN